jgi:glycosyltransferase involved in cell wall biosynthesis
MTSTYPQTPILSVVVPSWNSAEYLPRCLASFGDAKSHGVEVIVVDNASTDQTPSIVKDNEHVVSRFISERDRGQSDALNKGLAQATGTFFCWLNSDDEFVPGAVAALAKMLERAAGDWYTAGMVWIDPDSRVIRCSPHLPVWAPLSKIGISSVGGPSSFIRRSIAARAGPYNEKLHFCMDADMWYRLHRMGVRLRRLPGYVWAFRVHHGSKTSHVHLTGNMSEPMAEEIRGIYTQHGVFHGRGWDYARLAATRMIGAASLRDARAAVDTGRFRGRPVSTLPRVE